MPNEERRWIISPQVSTEEIEKHAHAPDPDGRRRVTFALVGRTEYVTQLDPKKIRHSGFVFEIGRRNEAEDFLATTFDLDDHLSIPAELVASGRHPGQDGNVD